jgi:hypothetical protein
VLSVKMAHEVYSGSSDLGLSEFLPNKRTVKCGLVFSELNRLAEHGPL